MNEVARSVAENSGVAESSGLIDIIEPAVPVVVEGGSWLWIGVAIALVLILIAAFIYLWKYKLPAYRSVKRLREVRQQIHAGELTLHESVLVIALELRQGLAIKRLRAEEVPPGFKQQDAAMWAEFMKNLEAMLYQPSADLSTDKHTAIYAQIEIWLWRYGR